MSAVGWGIECSKHAAFDRVIEPAAQVSALRDSRILSCLTQMTARQSRPTTFIVVDVRQRVSVRR